MSGRLLFAYALLHFLWNRLFFLFVKRLGGSVVDLARFFFGVIYSPSDMNAGGVPAGEICRSETTAAR
jgi:hypothetical protein